jgi:outer membrane immunogenic protein
VLIDTETTSKQLRDHIVRVGLNYRFGGAPLLPGYAAAAPAPIYKAPPVSVAFSWAGFYLGGNVGYGVSRNHGTNFLEASTAPFLRLVQLEEQFTLGPSGGLAGPQLGYNWQLGPHWVVGAEADWEWTGQKDSICIHTCIVNPVIVFSPEALALEQDLRWLATLRGRLGYARDGWLWYVTGGGAWSRVTGNDSFTLISGIPGALPGFVTTTSSYGHNVGGWTGGTGAETALQGIWSNWSAKFEYLYVGLGSTTNTLSLTPLSTLCLLPIGCVPTPQVARIRREVRDNIFRFGLNYHFASQ